MSQNHTIITLIYFIIHVTIHFGDCMTSVVLRFWGKNIFFSYISYLKHVFEAFQIQVFKV